MESNSQRVYVDNEKLKRLILRIYHAERENFKTKKFPQNQMVERIRKMIEQEAWKDDN